MTEKAFLLAMGGCKKPQPFSNVAVLMLPAPCFNLSFLHVFQLRCIAQIHLFARNLQHTSNQALIAVVTIALQAVSSADAAAPMAAALHKYMSVSQAQAR
jgi:hypothetical protein